MGKTNQKIRGNNLTYSWKPIVIFLLLAVLFPLVSAEVQLACIGEGETIEFSLCNPLIPDFTCDRDICQICVNEISPGVYCQSNYCNSLGLTCSNSTTTTIDQSPPILEILSPIEEEVYTSRSVFLNLESSERATIHFIDNQDNRGRWTTLCNDCLSHSRARNFDEGLNDLMFRVVDRTGNTAFFNLTFYIDSKEPRISSTEPRSGFASGSFKVKFDESNPILLVLNYGNSQTGFRQQEINLETECVEERDTECETQVALEDYDEQQIQYFFELTDVADSTVQSKTEELAVDNLPPEINSFDFEVEGRRVTFFLDVAETNFDEAIYYDSSDLRPRWKKLCSNPLCEKKINFADGNHDVEIKIFDEAGNEAQTSASFFTDSKKPKISKTEPRRDFASEEFYIKFDEINPVSLVLDYGNSQTGFNQHVLDIENSCSLGNRYYECLALLDLSSYDSEEIEYSFTLTDIIGQQDSKGESGLPVDTTFPEITQILHSIERSRADVTLSITEENFEGASYINGADSSPRERTFCSRLSEGECNKRISLRSGTNLITFVVYDEAGNSIAQDYEIVL